MKKIRFLLALLCSLTLISQTAFAEAYSFLRAGARIEMQPDWTLVTLETLDENAASLAAQGIDTKLLRLDMETSQAVFAVFLPDETRVMLSRYETEKSTAWHSVKSMTDMDRANFLSSYEKEPYENVQWVEEMDAPISPYLRFSYQLQSDGQAKAYAGISTIWLGGLYQLIATGEDPQALQGANEQVLASLQLYRITPAAIAAGAQQAPLPEPIADDGKVVPLTLQGFTGVSYNDVTTLQIQTLPGAEVIVLTANDRLRALADEQGLRSFDVSTRRETVYEYTIEVHAPERTSSSVTVSLHRQLSPEIALQAYQKSAQSVEAIGYENLLADPSKYTDRPLFISGKITSITEEEGVPHMLIQTQQKSDQTWTHPIWLRLSNPADLEVGESYRLYGNLLPETMRYTNADGADMEAPVLMIHVID